MSTNDGLIDNQPPTNGYVNFEAHLLKTMGRGLKVPFPVMGHIWPEVGQLLAMCDPSRLK